MNINLTINGTIHNIDISPGDSLMNVLRTLGYVGVKHGCETGECGACTVLVDSHPTNACIYLAAQAEGHAVETVEALGEHPDQGWKTTSGLHRIQEEFVVHKGLILALENVGWLDLPPRSTFFHKIRTGAPEEFLSKPWYIRSFVAVAGPGMNFVLAIVL